MTGKMSTGKRIAQNTMLLYFRSIIVMFISIYASRVLLQTLGVEDYGLYNVVGGVIAIFSSLKNVFASSVQRFLNFEKGKGNLENVRKIFNMSTWIHLGIAVLFAIILEVFGLWYISNKLIIPEDNLSTALFVFHCSVIGSMIAIYTIPYDAVIIANERMNFYAWQSIIDNVLRLLIIFLLPLLPFECLRSYAVFVLCVTLIIRSISVLYCKRFYECKKLNLWDRSMFKELITFAGWNFFGCISYSLVEEGSNLILNLFGGVVANAARGLAYQVRSAIMTLSNNVLVASQPFVTQKAATVDKNVFWDYIFMQSRMMFYIVSITALPIFIYVEPLLKLWLKDVPLYTVDFVRAILFYVLIMSFQKPLDLSFKSYNKMVYYQIVDAIVLLITLPTVFVALKLELPLYVTFLSFSIIRIIDYVAVLLVAKNQLALSITSYLKKVILPCIMCFFIMIILIFCFINRLSTDNLLLVFLCILFNVLLFITLIYLFVMTNKEKDMCIHFLSRIINYEKSRKS